MEIQVDFLNCRMEGIDIFIIVNLYDMLIFIYFYE